MLIFDELYSKTQLYKDKIMYPIIAGSKEIELVLSVQQFTTDRCKIHEYEVIHNKEKIALTKKSEQNYEYRHKVKYSYPKRFVPFHCIWPTLNGVKSDLILHSCRHSNVSICESIYPDIKWSFAFHIGAERDKKTKKVQLDCGFRFASEWDDENKNFSFAVKYPFTNLKKDVLDTLKGTAISEVKEVIIDFINPVVNGNFRYLLFAIENILKFLGTFMEASEDMEEYYTKKNNFMKGLLARKTVTPQLKFPKFSFGASWLSTTYKRDIGVKLAVAIKGMLIGFKATIDLYACLEKIPKVGQCIKAIRWLLDNFLNIETKFEIVFDSDITAGSDMSYNTASRKGKAEVYVSGKLDVSVNLEASQETSKSATIVTTTYGADGETGLFVKVYFRKFAAGQEDDTPTDGIYGDLKAGMKALEVGIFKEESVKKKGRIEAETVTREGKSESKHKEYLFGGKKTLLDKIDFIPGEKDYYRFFIR